jgi:small subunit ribosomal protein S5e
MAEVKVEDINLEADKPEFAVEPKLFGKWSYDGIQCDDISLAAYLQVRSIKQQVYIPYTAGRYQQRKFKKVQCPIVERLVTMMMVSGGRNNGKKQMAMRIVKQVFELIHLLTGLNPLQVLVDAMKLGGAREDSTRIGKGGAVRRQAVDVSPLRRIQIALYLMHKGATEAAFRSLKSIQECMADEIINASKGPGSNSYALRKKDEIERVAKGNR